jgi:predicted TIM-barrel fold metal-dependent hydrolase
MLMRTDLHQHVWTEPLLDALAARRLAPFVRRSDGLTVLHCPGELPCVIDEAAESPAARAHQLRADGLDQVAVAISSPSGIETLAPEAAGELIAAHLDGVLALGESFRAWGPIPVRAPGTAAVDEVLARGCIGISVPAAALADRAALEDLLPVLGHVQSCGVPLFVHPGGFAPREALLDEPLWWTALTEYVSQMQAAWLTFSAFARRELPHLRVVFAMLAGGAPLLAERLIARGAPAVDLRDPQTFYDTSSYGPMIVEAMARWVGSAQLVYGSDRPVIEPVATGREVELMNNATQLLIPARALA